MYWITTGAYEPPKAAKEHETSIVPGASQSKSIGEYFPCKESKTLLFEAV